MTSSADTSSNLISPQSLVPEERVVTCILFEQYGTINRLVKEKLPVKCYVHAEDDSSSSLSSQSLSLAAAAGAVDGVCSTTRVGYIQLEDILTVLEKYIGTKREQWPCTGCINKENHANHIIESVRNNDFWFLDELPASTQVKIDWSCIQSDQIPLFQHSSRDCPASSFYLSGIMSFTPRGTLWCFIRIQSTG
jgi:hypothetical protein